MTRIAVTLRGALALLVGLWALVVGAQAPILTWPGAEKDPHPCLYVTAKDLAAAKATRQDLPALAKLGSFNIDGALDQVIAAALLTDNAGAKEAVIKGALAAMDALIAKLPSTTKGGTGPHAYAKPFGVAVALADAALAQPSLSPADRAALLSKIAQASYGVNDPGYFHPECAHGSLCPNMFTSAAAYRLTLAALIPSHPHAKAWFDGALAELRQELADWVDPQGGMAEAPHYSMVIFDQWVGAFVIARNAGAPNDGELYHPSLRRAIEWFANISTPPEKTAGGLRRLPSLGHTYANERSGMFGVMAALWRTKDPAFAAQMAWMHRQHGSPAEPGILSYYPSFMGYRGFFQAAELTPKPLALGSQFYQETGVQLRNTMGSDRETTLYLIAGRFHSHYFNDSGSITLWGKGSELCDEDDYQKRRNSDSRAAHSMPDKPATYNEERVMELREFSTSPHLDYTSGVRRGWQRQIAFVKDADPLAPNYVVLTDTLDAKSVPTLWRLFLRGQVAAIPGGVRLTGKEDVDLEVIFLRPAGVQPRILADHIALPVTAEGSVSVLLYPRLRGEAGPKVTVLAEGRGVQVTSAAGTDTVYLNPDPVTAELGGQPFSGRVGLHKERGAQKWRVAPGDCPIPRDFWPTGDPQLRQIKWPKGPQYPVFPDYEGAVIPAEGRELVLAGTTPAEAKDFTVPKTGGAPSQATTVSAQWTPTALELVFTCADSAIAAAETGRDNLKLWRDDSVYVWLDPGHSHNPAGKLTMLQVTVANEVHDQRDGDPKFDLTGLVTKVTRTPGSWTAHLTLPWAGLGVTAPKPGEVWGINFSRMDQPGKVDHDRMQASSWVPIPFANELTSLDRWGHLLFAAPDDATATPARTTMAATHQAIIKHAYSPEVLLKGQ